MKRGLQIIGLITLLLVSFIYTEKTVSVVKESDEIMIEIKNNVNKYYQKPIEAIVKDDTIIPGISGREVDINKSYRKMKQFGSYNNNLLIYKTIAPTTSINRVYDKYIIGGNNTKNMVTLVLNINTKSDLDSLIKILDKRNTEPTLFIEGEWLEKNNEILTELSKKYEIGNSSYSGNYLDPSFPWIDTIIKRVIKQNYSYCLMESKNKDYLNICHINNNHTIIPNINAKNNLLSSVKEKLVSGSIIAVDVNDNTLKELSATITYIESRGLAIKNLKEHLSE